MKKHKAQKNEQSQASENIDRVESEEERNLTVLVFGFLGMIAVGLVGMFVAGLIQTSAYESQLSNAIESFQLNDQAQENERQRIDRQR